MSIHEGLQAGMDAFLGTSYEPDPSNGCCYAATGIASYYSEWAANEFNHGVFYVPTLVEDAISDGMYVDFSYDNLEEGDIIVFGDCEHVVISTGGNSYVGNSSSRGYILQGSDFNYMSGLEPTGIVKTTWG